MSQTSEHSFIYASTFDGRLEKIRVFPDGTTEVVEENCTSIPSYQLSEKDRIKLSDENQDCILPGRIKFAKAPKITAEEEVTVIDLSDKVKGKSG